MATAEEKVLFIENSPTIRRKGELFFIQVGPVAVCCTLENLIQFVNAGRRAIVEFEDDRRDAILFINPA